MALKTPRCYERRCKHFLGVRNPTPDDESGERVFCHAFEESIPDEIAYGDNLHLRPLPRQGNDIVYEREEEVGTFAFDPSQSRDEEGKWTSGGGGASKQGDVWIDASGTPLDARSQERLKSMRVPPAWKDVRLNPDESGALQVLGVDSKGRTQYLYSAEHSERMAAEKFARLKDFNSKMPGVRRESLKDMIDDQNPPELRDTAAVTYLISKTGLRLGSERDTGASEQAFGATTLQARHVSVSGEVLSMSFVGKKGVRIEQKVKDKDLANYVRGKEKKGKESLFDTSEGRVRDYFKSKVGDDFKVKDMRTWVGTSEALKMVNKLPRPETATALRKQRVTVAKHVSSVLGNTPAMALKAYIDPAVFQSWSR